MVRRRAVHAVHGEEAACAALVVYEAAEDVLKAALVGRKVLLQFLAFLLELLLLLVAGLALVLGILLGLRGSSQARLAPKLSAFAFDPVSQHRLRSKKGRIATLMVVAAFTNLLTSAALLHFLVVEGVHRHVTARSSRLLLTTALVSMVSVGGRAVGLKASRIRLA